MNDSDLSEINSTIATLNSTVHSFRPGKLQFAVIIPTAVQFVLCSIALVAIVRIPALRKGQNLFLVNLVIADLITTFVGIWITVLSFTDIDSEYKAARYANVCKAFTAIWYFQFFWLMWGTVLITYNRYSMVAHPFRPGITTRKALIEIACTCAVGLFIASLPFYTWAKYSWRHYPKKKAYKCGIDKTDFKMYLSFTIFYYTISYAVPVTLVTVFLVMILRRLLQSARATQRNAGVRSSGAVESGGTSVRELPSPSIVNSKTFWYVVVVVSTNALLPAPLSVAHLWILFDAEKFVPFNEKVGLLCLGVEST
ncbi:neuropeptide FF receptor 1-like [Oscarella lobularis]|uniref:neuropeptide FF receptor 1-like n=1 Tax=Oscarella lobularis TaxID=121494 RepID=UPI0033137081